MTTTAEQIRLRPDLHIYVDENELLHCCMTNGAVDISALEAHSQFVDLGTNGGTRCDVLIGMCACGAWHDEKEPRFLELQLRNKFRALFNAIYPKMTPEQNQEASGMLTKMVREQLTENPKNRKMIVARYRRKILAMAKKIKNKTA